MTWSAGSASIIQTSPMILATDLLCHRGLTLTHCPSWESCVGRRVSVSTLDKLLREQPCVVSGRRPVTLHHLRGGSVVLTPWGSPGAGQKQNEALKIPLHADYHVGQFGIDARINSGVQTWESRFGKQIDLLNQVSSNLKLCLWGLAWRLTPWKVQQDILRRCGQS